MVMFMPVRMMPLPSVSVLRFCVQCFHWHCDVGVEVGGFLGTFFPFLVIPRHGDDDENDAS